MTGVVLVLVVLGIGGGYTILNNSQQEDLTNDPIGKDLSYPVNETRLDEFAANRQSGGVPVDGIPAIEDMDVGDIASDPGQEIAVVASGGLVYIINSSCDSIDNVNILSPMGVQLFCPDNILYFSVLFLLFRAFQILTSFLQI